MNNLIKVKTIKGASIDRAVLPHCVDIDGRGHVICKGYAGDNAKKKCELKNCGFRSEWEQFQWGKSYAAKKLKI